jgi:hypothetical protein
MGTMNSPYNAAFTEGTRVRIKDRSALETFATIWKLHNPLRPEQLEFAGRTATVQSVGYYHGGDELYELIGIPGVWHAACLAPDI